METVNYRVSRYGKATKGDTLPYGTLARASKELRDTYYRYGYFHDTDFPDLPEDIREFPEFDLEETLHQNDLSRLLNELLDTLGRREATVLRMRFGIKATHDYTIEEIGMQFNVTSERIRQIEAKALRTLKHSSCADILIKGCIVNSETDKRKIPPQSTE